MSSKKPYSRKRKRKSSTFSIKKKKLKISPVITSAEVCCFCHSGEDVAYGTFFKDPDANIAAHQFCLLFSSGLPQRGDDEEGFDGFLLKDIYKEAQRASLLECNFCNMLGANVGCCKPSCKVVHHYKCGLNQGMQYIFAGSFNTFCPLHRSFQDLSWLQRVNCKATCPICLDNISVESASVETVIKTPCCKNVYIHRACVQRQASISGYFFRCPICNNDNQFTLEMSNYGIYIPSRDAAWEEPNAYSDLLEQYNKCDIKKCKCKQGRSYCTKAGQWHLIRCYLCGQSAVHVKCLGSHYIPGFGYVCADCNNVAKMSVTTANVILQPSFQERWKEHKRRLLELTSRDDPVLLASSVFAKRIWCKQFNVRPCTVALSKLKLPFDMANLTLTKKICAIVDEAKHREQKTFVNKLLETHTISSKNREYNNKEIVPPESCVRDKNNNAESGFPSNTCKLTSIENTEGKHFAGKEELERNSFDPDACNIDHNLGSMLEGCIYDALQFKCSRKLDEENLISMPTRSTNVDSVNQHGNADVTIPSLNAETNVINPSSKVQIDVKHPLHYTQTDVINPSSKVQSDVINLSYDTQTDVTNPSSNVQIDVTNFFPTTQTDVTNLPELDKESRVLRNSIATNEGSMSLNILTEAEIKKDRPPCRLYSTTACTKNKVINAMPERENLPAINKATKTYDLPRVEISPINKMPSAKNSTLELPDNKTSKKEARFPTHSISHQCDKEFNLAVTSEHTSNTSQEVMDHVTTNPIISGSHNHKTCDSSNQICSDRIFNYFLKRNPSHYRDETIAVLSNLFSLPRLRPRKPGRSPYFEPRRRYSRCSNKILSDNQKPLVVDSGNGNVSNNRVISSGTKEAPSVQTETIDTPKNNMDPVWKLETINATSIKSEPNDDQENNIPPVRKSGSRKNAPSTDSELLSDNLGCPAWKLNNVSIDSKISDNPENNIRPVMKPRTNKNALLTDSELPSNVCPVRKPKRGRKKKLQMPRKSNRQRNKISVTARGNATINTFSDFHDSFFSDSDLSVANVDLKSGIAQHQHVEGSYRRSVSAVTSTSLTSFSTSNCTKTATEEKLFPKNYSATKRHIENSTTKRNKQRSQTPTSVFNIFLTDFDESFATGSDLPLSNLDSKFKSRKAHKTEYSNSRTASTDVVLKMIPKTSSNSKCTNIDMKKSTRLIPKSSSTNSNFADTFMKESTTAKSIPKNISTILKSTDTVKKESATSKLISKNSSTNPNSSSTDMRVSTSSKSIPKTCVMKTDTTFAREATTKLQSKITPINKRSKMDQQRNTSGVAITTNSEFHEWTHTQDSGNGQAGSSISSSTRQVEEEIEEFSYEDFLPIKKRRIVCQNFKNSHLAHRYHIPQREWIEAKLNKSIHDNTQIEIMKVES